MSNTRWSAETFSEHNGAEHAFESNLSTEGKALFYEDYLHITELYQGLKAASSHVSSVSGALASLKSNNSWLDSYSKVVESLD